VTIFIVKIIAGKFLHLTLDNVPVVESDGENKNLAIFQKEYC
jgi:hypothetical protein